MKTHIKLWPVWVIGTATLCGTLILTQAQAYKGELNTPPTALGIPQFIYEGDVEGLSNRWGQKQDTTSVVQTSVTKKTETTTPTTTQTTAPTTTDQKNSFTKRKVIRPEPSPTPTPTPIPSPTPTPTPTPANVKWGAFTGWSSSEISSFEKLVGKPVNIVTIFAGLDGDSPFPSEFKSYVGAKGKTLLIFWEPYNSTLDEINNGSLDAYFTQYAADAKAYGGPVILAPFHEMNGNWDPWDGTVGSNSSTKLISAWKRMHGFFGSASNVKWGWAVNNVSIPSTPENAISAYWPGSSYVDYVGIDGFNFGNPWQTFDQVFGSAISQTKGYGKPIYLMSMASADGSNKAAWITDFGAQLAKHPEIVGWSWFNENKERDWRVNSDPQSLAAFKAILP